MSNALTKVAFIGAGYMGTEHAKAFKDIPEADLCGIFSRTHSRAENLAKDVGIPNTCRSIAELYEKTQADLVVISVPELSVRDVCLEAFKYPWACLIEKPAGYDIADAQSILDVAKRHGIKAYVALNRRHYSSTRTVLSDLAGLSGARLINVYDQEDQIAARAAKQPELVVKNWMYANSIHVIDYLSILGRGEIVTIEPVIRWNPENPEFVLAKITYESGDLGIYQAVWNGPGPWAVTITTQEKCWEMRPLEQASFQPFGSRKLEPVSTNEWDTKFKPGLRRQAEEAMKAVRGLPSTLPSLEEAMKSMRLVEAIYGNGYQRCQ
jgi:predicted dehydrogenase